MALTTNMTTVRCGWTKLLWATLLALLLAGCAATGPESTQESATEKDATPVDPLARQAFDAALKAMADGDDATAEKILLKMSRDFPDLSGPQANLGVIYFRAGQLDKAEAAFQRAVEIKPTNAVSLDYLGVIRRKQGRFKEAEVFYRRAIEADPKYATVHRNYGILLELYMGRLKDALAEYKQYQSLSGEEDKLVAKWIIDLERRSGAKK